MNKIAVVVDSTAVINAELLESNTNLYSIPLHLIIDEESYKDGLDITPSEFCTKMNQASHLPTTSQPPVGDVFNLFEELLKKYEYIIYITISSKLSGTFQTGLLVKNQLSNNRIIVFDSTFTSTIQKQMALKTLELIKMGRSIETIIENLEYIKENSKIYLVVDDLGHLHRTGRISLYTSSFGKLMNIKPLLCFDQGEIIIKNKVRTMNKVYNNLIDLIRNEKLSSNSRIIIAHANGYDFATKLKEKVLEIYPEHKIDIEELSPVISVHTGEKSFGISWIR
ncbi:DegV family protein [Clostridium rectalis]|uniref:DegV family protein n=1 Tax=Clostridium rectalis TaxID=2040295 RepID=UPI000F638081|nr:DegV family protein [Clostridium rectalis]